MLYQQCINAGVMLAQNLPRWPNLNPTFGPCSHYNINPYTAKRVVAFYIAVIENNQMCA